MHRAAIYCISVPRFLLKKRGDKFLKTNKKKSAAAAQVATGSSSKNAAAAADDRVESLPGLSGWSGTQFAGYASIYGPFNPPPADGDGSDEELFYWFVGTPDYAQRPTVLWTNGGPGSTSFWGFFLENGPFEIGDNGTVTPRPEGWNNYANYMIFEHPLSVGLSFAQDPEALPKTPEAGCRQYYQALLNFMAKHPEIAANPLILAGESYAGTYLPLLSKNIVAGNAFPASKLDLKGTVLLDAWVNPPVQMAADTTYAYSHGMISAYEKKILDETYTGSNLSNIDNAIQNICGLYMTNIAQLADPSTDAMTEYLNRDDVRDAIHAKKGQPLAMFSEAISELYSAGVNDSYADTVQELLDKGVPILVISGLNDAKDCNFLGTEAWLNLLEGDAALKFKLAPTTRWEIKTGSDSQTPQVLGYVQDGGLLRWVKVLNAGHMAVRDQPQIIHLILEKLLGGD
ncbi:MAG: S10 family peptidase [Acidobacteriota bacterium]|nr:S10 family peptidase [Acidobacteriota bacterium]